MKLNIIKIMALIIAGLMLFIAMLLNANAETQDFLSYEVSNNQATIVECDQAAAGNLMIPDTLGGVPVTSVGDFAFESCSGLKSVTISDSVTKIGDCAFYECSGLTSVTIPDSVTRIGEQAFEGCVVLKSITIPSSVVSVGSSAFSGTTWYVDQPYGLIYTGKVAYIYKGVMLEDMTIVLKSGTKEIADGAFSDCSGLTSITIPNSVSIIGEYAFSDCTGLRTIGIPNSVTSIGDAAFKNCMKLKSITIPRSVTSIDDFAIGYYGYLPGEEYSGYALKIPGFTIGCFADSVGLKYAKENRFAYKILPESAATDPSATLPVTTITNGSTNTTAVPTANDSGIGSKAIVPAVILAIVVFLAAAVTAVFIITKKNKK